MTHRIGIIGCGAIAQAAHIPGYLRAGCVIAAIADPRPEVLAELAARKLPAPKLYADHHAMLAVERLDAVSICTPNVLHTPVFHGCLGKVGMILLEKPVAIDLSSAVAMQAAAKQHGTRVMVAFSHRFGSIAGTIKEAVAAGRIGRPYQLRVRFAHTGPFPGWARTDWFYKPELAGGGAILDMGIHAFDLVRWIGGEVNTVSAQVGTLRKSIAVDDNAVVILEVGTGCLATVEVSWTSTAGFVGIEVMGDHGALIGNYGTDSVELVTGGTKPDGTSNAGREMLYAGKGTAPWLGQMSYFCNALSTAETLTPNLDDGIASLEIALAAMQSSRLGVRQPVAGSSMRFNYMDFQRINIPIDLYTQYT